MKRKKFSPLQVADIVKEFDAGKTVAEISREYDVTQDTYYTWQQRFGGMDTSELRSQKNLKKKIAGSNTCMLN